MYSVSLSKISFYIGLKIINKVYILLKFKGNIFC